MYCVLCTQYLYLLFLADDLKAFQIDLCLLKHSFCAVFRLVSVVEAFVKSHLEDSNIKFYLCKYDTSIFSKRAPCMYFFT